MKTEKTTKTEETAAKEKEPVLCGFVWCHGDRDFSLFEVDLDESERRAIEAILEKRSDEGTSVRNVWDERISDVMRAEYF